MTTAKRRRQLVSDLSKAERYYLRKANEYPNAIGDLVEMARKGYLSAAKKMRAAREALEISLDS